MKIGPFMGEIRKVGEEGHEGLDISTHVCINYKPLSIAQEQVFLSPDSCAVKFASTVHPQ